MGAENSFPLRPDAEVGEFHALFSFLFAWRKVYGLGPSDQSAELLKDEVRRYKDTRLNLVLIGHTGAGKSSFINSIFSVSRGRITSKATVKCDDVAGVGTYYFSGIKSRSSDLFQNVTIFDTMGFTGRIGDDDKGIKMGDLKAVCEGRVSKGHRFNEGATSQQTIKGNKPHCVIFVISAEEIENLSPRMNTAMKQKLDSMYKIVPNDVAKITVLTKVDRVCEHTYRDIRYIYCTEKVKRLVEKIQSIFGVPEDEIFPVVNFVTEMEVEPAKSVPILCAIKTALDYARRKAE